MHLLLPESRPDLSDADLLDLYAWPEGRRYLRANMVATIDGAVRGPDDTAETISNPDDKRVFKLLRHTSDAVIIGAGTVATEGVGPIPVPEEARHRRAERGQAPRPTLVVVSNRASLPPTARAVTGERGASTLMVVAGAADPGRVEDLRGVCEVLVLGDDTVDLPALLDELAERGLTRLLSEGGPTLLAALLPHLDELCLSTVPQLLGAVPGQPPRPTPDLLGGHVVAPRSARLGHLIVAKDTLLASWRFDF